MIKKVTIMITNVNVRYAYDINTKNEVANFNLLGIFGKNISATSWEKRNTKRSNGTVYIISEMIRILSGSNEDKSIYIYIQLSGYQPDTRIIRYKKTWGLLQSRGYDTSYVSNKKDIIIDGADGLELSGTGFCSVSSLNKLSALINDERKIYFATVDSDGLDKNIDSIKSSAQWMEIIWSKNGVVFMPLGALDENDCEVVALGKELIINILK